MITFILSALAIVAAMIFLYILTALVFVFLLGMNITEEEAKELRDENT